MIKRRFGKIIGILLGILMLCMLGSWLLFGIWLSPKTLDPWDFNKVYNQSSLLSTEVTMENAEIVIEPQVIVPSKSHSYAYEIIDDILYVKLYEFDDSKDFKNFLHEMFDDANKHDIKELAIMLTNSRGGASAAGDELLSYLTHQPTRQLLSSYLKVSPVSKSYLLTFIPDALRWTFLQYYLSPLRDVFHASEGDLVKHTFEPIRHKRKNIFSGDVVVYVNAGTMSSADLLYKTIEYYNIGRVEGISKDNVNHFGNQVAYTTHEGLNILIPTSFNVGNLSPVDRVS